MNRDGFTRFIPVILFVAVVVLIVAAFISISRGLFGESEPVDDPGRTSLTNTGSDRSVRMTVRGPIIAEEEHRSYQISISPDKREFTSYQGYLDRPIDRQQLDNNSQAYEEFVYALDRYGLMVGSEGENEDNDLRGRCPTGTLYEFETVNAGNVVKRLWSSSCRGDDATLQADRGDVTELFRDQIPEIRKLTRGLSLR